MKPDTCKKCGSPDGLMKSGLGGFICVECIWEVQLDMAAEPFGYDPRCVGCNLPLERGGDQLCDHCAEEEQRNTRLDDLEDMGVTVEHYDAHIHHWQYYLWRLCLDYEDFGIRKMLSHREYEAVLAFDSTPSITFGPDFMDTPDAPGFDPVVLGYLYDYGAL